MYNVCLFLPIIKADETDRDIRGSEEELSVEVGFLYGVHVSHNNLALLTGQTNHGKVFQQFAADGSSSNLEGFHVMRRMKLKDWIWF